MLHLTKRTRRATLAVILAAAMAAGLGAAGTATAAAAETNDIPAWALTAPVRFYEQPPLTNTGLYSWLAMQGGYGVEVLATWYIAKIASELTTRPITEADAVGFASWVDFVLEEIPFVSASGAFALSIPQALTALESGLDLMPGGLLDFDIWLAAADDYDDALRAMTLADLNAWMLAHHGVGAPRDNFTVSDPESFLLLTPLEVPGFNGVRTDLGMLEPGWTKKWTHSLIPTVLRINFVSLDQPFKGGESYSYDLRSELAGIFDLTGDIFLYVYPESGRTISVPGGSVSASSDGVITLTVAADIDPSMTQVGQSVQGYALLTDGTQVDFAFTPIIYAGPMAPDEPPADTPIPEPPADTPIPEPPADTTPPPAATPVVSG